jgi:hypothetical protein
MKYSFTRGVARIEIMFGVLIILAGTAVAAIMVAKAELFGLPILPQPNDLLHRSTVALAIFLVGLVIGASSIVAGQITLVFLDIARRVARIDRRQRRREQEEPPPDESRWINRLRRR